MVPPGSVCGHFLVTLGVGKNKEGEPHVEDHLEGNYIQLMETKKQLHF